jgi:hypothetical protein
VIGSRGKVRVWALHPAKLAEITVLAERLI